MPKSKIILPVFNGVVFRAPKGGILLFGRLYKGGQIIARKVARAALALMLQRGVLVSSAGSKSLSRLLDQVQEISVSGSDCNLLRAVVRVATYCNKMGRTPATWLV